MNTKKTLKTAFAAVALCMATAISAQNGTAVQPADTVILSQQTDGDYLVSRLLVRGTSPQISQYDVRYAISNSVLAKELDNNSAQLNDIAGYVDKQGAADTLRRVNTIRVTGYASPDGPDALNKSLAAARARNFANYLDKTYSASKHYKIEVNSEALPWSACRNAVAASSVPDRAQVLAILDSRESDNEKEMQLKRMPEVWNYLAANILPPMRRVDVTMHYDRDRVMTVRDRINPQPEPEIVIVDVERRQVDECCCPCCSNPIDEEYDGIIVEFFGCPDE